jgi:preprotein translocase subunit SecG
MQTLIIVIHLMIVTAMIGVVLLQKSEGGGLGIGSTGGFMSNRGTANVLTRATAVLAGSFFATSLILSILAGFHRNPTTILNPGGAPTGQSGTPPAQSQPDTTPGGLLDRLRQQDQQPAGGPPPQ